MALFFELGGSAGNKVPPMVKTNGSERDKPIVVQTGHNPFNPRYIAYAKDHNKTPEEMMAYDREVWAGGCMCGFILWMSKKHREFWQVCPSAFLDRHTISDQDAWTEFLQSVPLKRTKESK